MTNRQADTINQRAREIGFEIFESAAQAQPHVWQKAWWLEQMTTALDPYPALQTRLFQFVDCLPALQTNRDIARHLREYVDPNQTPWPRFTAAVLGAGRWQSWREEFLGKVAGVGAIQMAHRFITGYDIPTAMKTIQRLRGQGMAFTMDVLGESTTSYARADAYAQLYHDLIRELPQRSELWSSNPDIDRDHFGPIPRVNLSIKLTGLDPHFDAIDPQRSIRVVSERLRPLLRQARQVGVFINIDLESTKHREITFELFKSILMEDEFRDWTNIGIVVQAYLRSSEQDLRSLLDWGKRRGHRFSIRLVKGAYWDAETAAAVRNYKTPPVWTRKWESDACYERLTRIMLENTHLIRSAFASHNVRSQAYVLAVAESLGLSRRHFESQMLYGMGDPLKSAMIKLGVCLRVYCPYGDLMPGMGYLIRRLLENSSNDSFLKQSFTDRTSHERLLQDPAIAQPPSGPLPQRCYQNTFPEESMSTFKNASHTNFANADNRDKLIGAIQYVRGESSRQYPAIIDGEPVTTSDTFASCNPSNSAEIIGRVTMTTTTDADRAVAAATRAFDSWRHTSAAVRADLLRKVADCLEARRFELAATMILEVGKPWREADADVTEAIDHWRYNADQVEHLACHPRLRNLPGEDNQLTYSPKGVCAVISPWAFPLAILSGMTSAALAAGNTVVIKPACEAAILAAKLFETLMETGFPAGVINFLPGRGEQVGCHLVEHSGVNIVAFTGSQAVGTNVIRAGSIVRPSQAFIKKMIVEMGGKNAIIVDSDANLDEAVQAILESSFGYAGQKCSSCSRVIVINDIFDELAMRLTEAVKSLTLGSAELPATNVGPVINAQAVARFNEYLDLARQEASILVQASLPEDATSGYYAAPTVMVDVKRDARIAQEEILGPMLVLLKAANFDEALDIANCTRYALTGGIFSRSPDHINRAKQEFAVGNLYINRSITGSQVDAQPFGGFRLSGTGVKAGSPDYLLHFMDARCITENTLRSGLVPDENHSQIA